MNQNQFELLATGLERAAQSLEDREKTHEAEQIKTLAAGARLAGALDASFSRYEDGSFGLILSGNYSIVVDLYEAQQSATVNNEVWEGLKERNKILNG